MKSSPSRDKEHKNLCDTEQDICGSYTEASYHKSLNKTGSPHHSNDAYKHGAHNPLVFDTSFHKPNLDNKGPILFLQAPTPAWLRNNIPTNLHTGSPVTPLWAPM